MGAAMNGRFPRTPAEFAEHGRLVVLRCACGAVWTLQPASLIQRMGPDADLYDITTFMALEHAFPCEACGRRPEVSVYVPRRMWEAVPFEEATCDSLELSAYANARDASHALRSGQSWPPSRKNLGRVRKFGPR